MGLSLTKNKFTLVDKKIVITGGMGFIGSHLSKILSKSNEVHLVDNLLTGNKENHDPKAQLHEIDINNKNELEIIFKNTDYVFHLAALPSVPRSIENPGFSHQNNVNGTLSVLETARKMKIQKMLYSSSSSVYGDSDILPKVETMIPNPLSPYAVQKLVGEHYVKVYSNLYGLKAFSIRYFNVFGSNQDPHSIYSAVIAKFITNALQDKDLIVYGDGTNSRDFTYVEDVIQANISLIKQEIGFGEVYNFAKGNSTSIIELANRIKELTNSNSKILIDSPRAGDVKHSLANTEKFEKLTNFKSEYSLEDGLMKTISWYKQMIA